MARDPGPDDGREEQYAERGVADAGDGPVMTAHRYAAEQQYVDERELDRRAGQEARQNLTDAGRGVFGIPWVREHMRATKVKHRQWKREVNGQGWTHKGCGFPARTDEARILHQDYHAKRDRLHAQLAEDYEAQQAVNADLREQIGALADEVAYQIMRFDVLAVTVGHADPDALQATVERIMGYARDVAKRREAGRENGA